ncbi:MAG: zinc ABC transporter substrate-binding protein [Cellvibrionaceae bacterium]|nr:zinc ABC transporter substrate-binding protein [Cellvibrionaceae bacterium]
MRISNPLRPLLALFLFSFAMSAWSQAAEKLTLLSSIRPLSLLAADLVDGLPVEVNTLLPANADPHNWSMRVSDRQRLEAADLVVWLGPDFENFLVKPLRNLKPEKQLELGALASLQWPQKHEHEDDHHDHHGHHHGRDMHLWLNPANALEIQKVLVARLGEIRPGWRAVLQERLLQQSALINSLQADIQRRLSPHRQNGFIAYHDTYEHFVSAFGLQQLDAVNQFAEQRLSAKTLQRLQAHARGARCLMVEKNDAQETRLAKTLSLPVVVADGLALDPELIGFASFLENIAAAFETCISGVAE